MTSAHGFSIFLFMTYQDCFESVPQLCGSAAWFETGCCPDRACLPNATYLRVPDYMHIKPRNVPNPSSCHPLCQVAPHNLLSCQRPAAAQSSTDRPCPQLNHLQGLLDAEILATDCQHDLSDPLASAQSGHQARPWPKSCPQIGSECLNFFVPGSHQLIKTLDKIFFCRSCIMRLAVMVPLICFKTPAMAPL